jgi:integrase
MDITQSSKETVKIKAVLFKSKTLADGSHPIMMRITKDGKSSYKSTGYSSSVKKWDSKEHEPKTYHKNYEEIVEKIAEMRLTLLEEVRQLNAINKTVSSKSVVRSLSIEKAKYSKFLELASTIINELEQIDKIGNANVYKYCRTKVGKFLNPKQKHSDKTKKLVFIKDIDFPLIDLKWLRKFELYLINQGLKENARAQVFRTLRAIYNKAIDYRIVKDADYPFKDFKWDEFEVETIPDFIPLEDFYRIEDYSINPDSKLFDSRNYFVFSFYAGGLNFADIADLKWSDINGNLLIIRRRKTKRLIRMAINEPMRNILDYYEAFTKSKSDNYVFPIFNANVHETAKQRHDRFKSHRADVINPSLKEIASLVGLDRTITSKVARYTMATGLRESGIDSMMISKAMGRKSDRGLEVYLGRTEKQTASIIEAKLIRPNKKSDN